MTMTKHGQFCERIILKRLPNVFILCDVLSTQWFGNLVTMKWWDHLWLNEGFASFVEYVGTAEVEPDWGMVRTITSS